MPPVDVMSPVPDPRNQQPLDMDFEVLIVPEAIPIPGTSVEILQSAVSAMRTAAGEVAEGGEGIESTWQGLQPHYTAPESETLFAAMGPVAAKGGTILDDVTTVASALDTFADAAQTAKTNLNALKDEATTFAEEMRGEENWSNNPLNYSENRRLKLQVNGVWATFQEAERTCANAVSAVSGSGNSYVAASGEAPGAGEIVYGLDPDDVPDVAYDLTSLADWQRAMEDTWHQLEYSEKPWPADWATDAFMAQWDNFGPGMLWDVGVGAVAWTGLWREGSGWANSVGEATDNFVTHKQETLEGLGSLTGLYGEDGWMNPFDSGERSGETWRANAGAAWTEVAHDVVPWREWEDRPAYTVYTGAGNAALAVVSLPARGGTILANLGRGGSDLPDLDPVERPEVVWEPGAAARPGFSLSQTFSDISGDFSDTTEGFGAGFGDLSAMVERFSAGDPVGGGVPGGGGGSDLPVFVPEPGSPVSGRPVSVPVTGDSGAPDDGRPGNGRSGGDRSGDPDRPRREDEPEVLAAADQPDPPRRGDEDRPSRAPHHLDAPSTERWPEMEEFLESEHRREDDEQSVADRSSEVSDADFHRPLDVTADEGSGAAPNDRLFSSLGLDAREIEREYERDVERTTQQVVDMVEGFRALPAERQLEWLRVNQLVGANAVEGPAGPQGSGFGGPCDDGFGITASHDPNSGNGGGPPRTPQDGTSNTGFTPTPSGDGDTSRGDTASSRPVPEGGHRPTNGMSGDLPLRSDPTDGTQKDENGTEPSSSNGNSGNRPTPTYPNNDKPEEVNKDNYPELRPKASKVFGEGIELPKNKKFEVPGRGIFYTDNEGKVVFAEVSSGRKYVGWNVELRNPRPDCTYIVDGRYTYETDSLARTVSVEGVLENTGSDNKRRHPYQNKIGNEGAAEYAEINEVIVDNFEATGSSGSPVDGRTFRAENSDWNGGHFIGTQFFGAGERLNIIPMLEGLNQSKDATDTHLKNYYKLEDRWAELTEKDPNTGMPKAKIEVRIRAEYESDMRTPARIRVDYTIDGVPQQPVRLTNIPQME